MKCILYILDGLTPLAIKNELNYKFFGKQINSNFISKIASNSVRFDNAYGYGETLSTTYEYLTGENIYKNNCDAFKLFNSFPVKKNLATYFKEKGFKTIYYRDSAVNFHQMGFYGRYFRSVTNDFDIVCRTKKYEKYSFKNFFNENNISSLLEANKNNFFLFHDHSLHDNKIFNKDGTPKSYLKAVNASAKIVERNLNIIKYNKKKDILIFVSDHGLNLLPSSKMHFLKKIKKKEYDSYYPDLFIDEKIKVTFFICNIGTKKIIFKSFIKPNNVFSIIKYLSNNIFNENLKKNIYSKLKVYSQKKILISLQAAKQDFYNNFFFKDYFHCHILSLSKYNKIAFSFNHAYQFYDLKNKNFKTSIKNNKELKMFIKDYFSVKNYIKKFLMFILSLFVRAFSKFFRIFFY